MLQAREIADAPQFAGDVTGTITSTLKDGRAVTYTRESILPSKQSKAASRRCPVAPFSSVSGPPELCRELLKVGCLPSFSSAVERDPHTEAGRRSQAAPCGV